MAIGHCGARGLTVTSRVNQVTRQDRAPVPILHLSMVARTALEITWKLMHVHFKSVQVMVFPPLF